MAKLKCAFMCPTDAYPLPTRKQAEKQFNAKVLYGLGKHRVEKTPYAKSMHLVEHAFQSVSDMFSTSQTILVYSGDLIAFDNCIDETLFLLSATSNTITRFSVDDQIINEMRVLAWKIRHLNAELNAHENELNSLIFYQQNGIGDSQFLGYIPRRKADVQDYSREVQRMLDIYKSQLKALFSSGW